MDKRALISLCTIQSLWWVHFEALLQHEQGNNLNFLTDLPCIFLMYSAAPRWHFCSPKSSASWELNQKVFQHHLPSLRPQDTTAFSEKRMKPFICSCDPAHRGCHTKPAAFCCWLFMQSNSWRKNTLGLIFGVVPCFFFFFLYLLWFAEKRLVGGGWKGWEKVFRAVTVRMFSFKRQFDEFDESLMEMATKSCVSSSASLTCRMFCEIFGNASAPGWSGLVDSCMRRNYDTTQRLNWYKTNPSLFLEPKPWRIMNHLREMMKINVWGWRSLAEIKGLNNHDPSFLS